MKKILITTGIFPPDIGGPATYGATMASALAEHGFGVSVVTYSDAKNLKLKIKNEKLQSKIQNFEFFRISKRWPKGLRHLIYFFKILVLITKTDTVLALNASSAGFPALVSAKIFKKKFIIRVVGDYAWEIGFGKGRINSLIDDFQKDKKRGWIGMLYKLQGLVCRKADLVIVPSRYLAGIVKGWGVSESKIKIIYNGVDFKPTDFSKEEARNKIGIHGNIILSIGRLVPWKGFRMLIKIMPQLLSVNQFARLVIVGDGPDREPLNSMIRNLKLEKRAYLVGKKSKEDLSDYLAAADMFILNTGYEGFSHQILEAMSAGVPVVTTAVGGNKEIIKQGENGFLIKYNDEFNIIEAIKALWNDKDLGAHFIEEGKKTVNKFSLEKMIEETIKVLSSSSS